MSEQLEDVIKFGLLEHSLYYRQRTTNSTHISLQEHNLRVSEQLDTHFQTIRTAQTFTNREPARHKSLDHKYIVLTPLYPTNNHPHKQYIN